MEQRIEMIVSRITKLLGNVCGINAIVLGGSHATGTASESSDIDIGVYYDDKMFDLEAFKRQATLLDDNHRDNCITNIGEWGKWINGGGWLSVDSVPVDILFRSTSWVTDVIEECLHGTITIDYQCGHPFGFVNSIYMGEVAHCKILSARNNLIENQKEKLIPYPETYRRAAIDKFLWECEFSLSCGRKAIGKQDVLYAAGSLYRCAMSLIQVLYAVNRMYCLNEKGSLKRLTECREVILPAGFAQDMEAVFSCLDAGHIKECFTLVEKQLKLVRELAQ